jgi:4-amino-4-deoxy-L-arabinose transferase-like glycosyltransferase
LTTETTAPIFQPAKMTAMLSLMLKRFRIMILSDDPLGTWIFATIFFVIALITRLIIIILVPDLTWNGSVVAGAPYSDAQDWYSLALSVYEGHGLSGGWSARRPLYAILMATVFSWTGPSYLVAVLINAVLGSAAVAFVYLICERVFNRLVAIPTALAISFNVQIIMYSLVTLSETAGFFFSLVALWFLISAAERGRFSHSFLAGILFGLENLTRTISLLALPGFTFFLGLVRYRNGHNLKRAVVVGTVFVIGVGVALSPWIIRQKIVHGIFAISDNTASGLYAASSPKWKSWQGGVDKEADEKGIKPSIKDRYEYFNQAFISNLKDYPSFYLKNVSASFLKYLIKMCPMPFDQNVLPFTLILSVLLIVAINKNSFRHVLMIATLMVVWGIVFLLIPYHFRSLVIPVLFLLGLIYWPEKSQVFLINSAIFIGLGASLFALGGDTRVVLAATWVPIAFFYAIFIRSSELAIQKYGQSSESGHCLNYVKRDTKLWERQEKWLRKFKVFSTAGIIVLAVMTMLGFSKLVWSNFIAFPPVLPTHFELSNTQRQEILSYLKSRLPKVVLADDKFFPLVTHIPERSENHGRLAIAEGRIFDGIIHRLPPGSNPFPPEKMFEKRAYRRSCFYLGGLRMIFPFDIPKDFSARDLVAVGRFDVDTVRIYDWLVFEGLAIFPYDRKENKILFNQGLIADSLDHLKLVRSLGDSIATTRQLQGAIDK